ncbi:hypothetical protein [Streptomyces montanus]|uniref:hypothetical protein n=1 Tax=Streptomyces montanus TaxID=2580423 RepID=UPI001485D6D1|nr:hypothetical protein [Streptomyces montanus]
MTDSSSRADADGREPDALAHPGMPRWAKVFGFAAGAALLVAFVLMHLLSGGMRGH